MAISHTKEEVSCDVSKVWKLITDFSECAWRSDLERTEILDESKFIEYTKEGFATVFIITVKEPQRRLEFKMDNSNMSGHWIGLFGQEGAKTVLDFTEEVTAKKFWMKPFVGMYLKKQQAAYVKDLRMALEGAAGPQ